MKLAIALLLCLGFVVASELQYDADGIVMIPEHLKSSHNYDRIASIVENARKSKAIAMSVEIKKPQKETVIKVKYAVGCVVNTAVAVWGWNCTRTNGQLYVKVTAGFFTLRAASDFVKAIF